MDYIIVTLAIGAPLYRVWYRNQKDVCSFKGDDFHTPPSSEQEIYYDAADKFVSNASLYNELANIFSGFL